MPISRHPLFAPMVALWFATLFGLGSLAIRPTLLESFVLALRLDLVIPAAAPPLGLTFRILLALFLFVVGGAIGFIMVRKFTRSAASADAGSRFARKDGKSQTTAAPVVAAKSSDDEDDDFARLDSARQTQQEVANSGPVRRRSLAMDEGFRNDYHDFVPLPGGEPQILDLADLGPISEVNEAEHAFPAEVAKAEFGAVEVAQHAQGCSDDQFAATPVQFVPQPEEAGIEELQTDAEPNLDPWRRHPAKVAFQPTEDADVAQVDFSRPAPQSGFAQPAPFAAPVAAMVAEEHNPEPQPAFQAAPQFAAPQQTFEAVTLVEQPLAETSHAHAPGTNVEVGPMFGQVTGDAAERLVASPVGSLGVVQLAERLALAIARKRDGVQGAPPAFEVESPAFVAPLSPPVPVPSPLPPIFSPPSSFAAPQEPAFAAPAVSAPFTALQEAQSEEVEPEAAAFARPASPELPETVSAANFAVPPAMPAALRPLSFDDGSDDEPLDAFVPPRGFVVSPLPAVAPAPVVEPVAVPVPNAFEPQPSAAAPHFAEPAEVEHADAADDEAYASLLGMKAQNRPFVRIEEPAEESTAIEPVVIFPGQDMRPAFHPSQAFASAAEPDAMNASRPFDAPPPSAFAPVRMPSAPAPAIDPGETERQLKAALATLQRMSGAA